MRRFLYTFLLFLWAGVAHANVPCSVPFNLLNGTTADATQVMANYNAILTCLQNAALAGANNDITSLSALTTPLSRNQGGSPVYIGGTSTGTVNAQQVTVVAPTGFVLTAGNTIVFKAGLTNTDGTTLQINATAVTTVTKAFAGSGPVALSGGELQTGMTYIAVYDGTQFILINPSPVQTVRTLTSTGSVAGTDDHGKIVLSGGAYYALSLGAPGGFTDQNFYVDIVNQDNGRAKQIQPSGAASFYLGPNLATRCTISAGTWECPNPGRWLIAGANFYVDPVFGNDSNDCLAPSTGACQSIHTALLRMKQNLDAQNSEPNINLACGTYIDNINDSGQLTGYNVYLLQGASSQCAILQLNGALNFGYQVGDNAEVQIRNVRINNIGGVTNAFGINVHQTGVVDYLDGNAIDGAFGNHFACDNHGMFNLSNSYSVNGNASVHVTMGPFCSFSQSGSMTVTINNVPTIGIWFQGAGLAMFNLGSGITFSGASGGVSLKWSLIGNSFASFAGNTIPGVGAGQPAAGTTPWGAQVSP